MKYNYYVKSSFGCGNIQALQTIKEINSLSSLSLLSGDTITFNFTKFGENNPFNVLVLASFLKDFRGKYPDNKFKLIPKGNNDFLSHLGFYHMIGADFGKEIGEAKSSSNYIPITELNLKGYFYNYIDKLSDDFANLLNFDNKLGKFISYAFVETIRNVYEHSGTKKVYVCAQKWQKFNLVEIAIIDNGCGIASCLKKRFTNKSNKELLYLSLMPGITAGSNHKFRGRDDIWRNSGYGLYALRKLSILYKGSFLLCSGDYALRYNNNGVEEFDTVFPGTAIAIRIKTNTNNNFDALLQEVIKDGEKEAKERKNTIKTASKKSRGANL